MGVYIDGLDMPTSCNKCPFTCEALQFFNGTDRPQRCPLFEIVRCGECKYYNPLDEDRPFSCEYDGREVNKTDFCSYGERRADEEMVSR